MTGICGWIGQATPEEPARRQLELMEEGHFSGAEQSACVSLFGETFALSMSTPSRSGSYHDDDSLAVVIVGDPVWAEAKLQAMADDLGDAQVVARLFSEQGAGFLQHLLGMFSLVIVEKKLQRALLAIDRFGVHSLAYSLTAENLLVFGTSTDSVRFHPAVAATVSPQTIYNYLHFVDRICAPATVYDEQHKLVPAAYLVFDSGKISSQTYWRMPYSSSSVPDKGALGEGLLDRLRNSVKRSLRGEDTSRVGAFLSGGLDSSTVVSLLCEQVPSGPKSFTIGFHEHAYNETEFAAIAAKHAGADHSDFFLGPDHMIDMIPKLAQAYDEPFANSSVIPAYYCALYAKEAGVDLMLAGDGGDELFAGNERYIKDRIFQHYRKIPKAFRNFFIQPLVEWNPLRGHISLFRKALSYVKQARLSIPERMIHDSVYASLDFRKIFSAEALAEIDPRLPARFIEEIYADAPASNDLQRMMYVDLRITLADSDLRKVGRACDLAGVRVKYPFLNEDLAEFSAKIPPSLLLENGALRSFYKQALSGVLAKETLEKEKHGFGLPTFEYINKSTRLQDMLCDYLSASKKRNLFRADTLDILIGRTRAGECEAYHGLVWDLALLEIWLQGRSL